MKIKLPKFQYNSPVILTMTLISAVALLLNWITHGWSNAMLFTVYRTKLTDPLLYLRLFTHALGHANYSHFIGNYMLILLVGPMMEEKYGSAAIVKVIVIAALITGLVNYIFFPGVAICGASGVVFAFIILTSFTGFGAGEIPLTFILIAVIFIGQQIFEGAFVKDNISQVSHIIGGLVGAVIGYMWNKR